MLFLRLLISKKNYDFIGKKFVFYQKKVNFNKKGIEKIGDVKWNKKWFS